MRIARPALALGTATIGLLALVPLGPAASAAAIPTYTCEFTEERHGIVHGHAACSASQGAVRQGFYRGPSIVRGYKGPTYNCHIGGVANIPEEVTAIACVEDEG